MKSEDEEPEKLEMNLQVDESALAEGPVVEEPAAPEKPKEVTKPE